MEKSLIDKSSFLLCIRCMTYNQSAYITDALNGFTMQQTNFPFVAVVVDDASTDGEQKVIKTYLKEHFDHSEETGYKEWETEDAFWTFARNAENKNCYFVVVLLKQNLFGNPKKDELIREWCDTKYIALCEGDDYWTGPLKLQKQVDFLEEHEEYSMCFHGAEIKSQTEVPAWVEFQNVEDCNYSATELFERWIVPTASIVYLKSASSYALKHPENILNGDIFLVENCAHVGKVYGMKEKMSVYNIQNQGVTYNAAMQEKRLRRYPDHYKEIKRSFPLIDKHIVNRRIADSYFNMGGTEKSWVLKYMDFVIGALYCPKALMDKTNRVIRKRLMKNKGDN